MSIQAVAVQAGWIVEGECADRGFHRPCTDECPERLLPPSVLTDAIGNPCETGLASVELTVPCGAATHVKHWAHPADCIDGQVTVRVIPDKVPVQIMGGDLRGIPRPVLHVPPNETGRAYLYAVRGEDDGYLDIGPNPAEHVGKYLLTGSVVSS